MIKKKKLPDIIQLPDVPCDVCLEKTVNQILL